MFLLVLSTPMTSFPFIVAGDPPTVLSQVLTTRRCSAGLIKRLLFLNVSISVLEVPLGSIRRVSQALLLTMCHVASWVAASSGLCSGLGTFAVAVLCSVGVQEASSP